MNNDKEIIMKEYDVKMVNDNNLESLLLQQFLLMSNLRSPSPKGVNELDRNKNRLATYVRETVLQENFFTDQLHSNVNFYNNNSNNNENNDNDNNNAYNPSFSNCYDINHTKNISKTLNQVLTDQHFWDDVETMIEETFSRSK